MTCWLLFKVNPIEYGHVFLVPHGFDRLYQVVDARYLEMVVRVAVEINNLSFRVFYNWPRHSHLYFQVLYCLLLSWKQFLHDVSACHIWSFKSNEFLSTISFIIHHQIFTLLNGKKCCENSLVFFWWWRRATFQIFYQWSTCLLISYLMLVRKEFKSLLS